MYASFKAHSTWRFTSLLTANLLVYVYQRSQNRTATNEVGRDYKHQFIHRRTLVHTKHTQTKPF